MKNQPVVSKSSEFNNYSLGQLTSKKKNTNPRFSLSNQNIEISENYMTDVKLRKNKKLKLQPRGLTSRVYSPIPVLTKLKNTTDSSEKKKLLDKIFNTDYKAVAQVKKKKGILNLRGFK